MYSEVNHYNFTNQYSAEWQAVDEFDGYWRIQVTLRIKGLDYSTWSDQGSDGAWLGVGFGGTKMMGSDIVMCQFKFTTTTFTSERTGD